LRGDGRVAARGYRWRLGIDRHQRLRCLARAFGDAARPVFIVSAILLIAGALACSRVVAALAGVAFCCCT